MKGTQGATFTRTFALSLVALLVLPTSAREPDRPAGSSGIQAVRPKAAGCVPASAVTQIAYNNVRAVIENGGNMWTRRGGSSRSGYEVPKTSDFTGACSIYAGGLWMGGVGPDNNLKLAAVLFRAEGNDFWPGPLTNTGDASVSPEVCGQYDRFWVTERSQAESHIQWKQCSDDPECDLDEVFPEGYSIPTSFTQWPALGDVDEGQDLYLAPFFDYNGDGIYEPTDGDYPDYGFDESVEDCKNRQREDPVNLFGDYNIFWIFNDKGDVHTESFGGQPIGLEVRAQAFAFSSNNEINNMTFYNYTVINQGTQTLLDTYFGHFVDPDVGCSNDDFVGCDVQRGLGFAYNWDDNDDANCQGAVGYGAQPPGIGVDFFEGPYQDADGVDNPGPQSAIELFDCVEAQQQHGIPYKGIGIGYGDGFADNERFGMRAFLYWNRDGPFATSDPGAQGHFYNYLRGIWKNGLPMTWGGSGYNESPAAIQTRYMFPWSSDPVGWGTNCVPQPDWRESLQAPQDRRFVQSAGPFTLEPGAYNNITLGVVYARAATGGATASVTSLRVADDKAQSLFDNCFKILDGPDAPDLEIVELDRELIILMSNPKGSNNNVVQPFDYEELDPIIPELDGNGQPYDRNYRFQGYMLYQLKNDLVSVSDLDNIELARLVYQGDIQDDVAQIINYPFDQVLDLPVATEMVRGANVGVASSVRLLEDAFASGDPRLVNFKSYYYLAIAYGYNNYEPYNFNERTGQPFSFVASRKGAFGAIRKYVGIPHLPDPSSGGTIQNSLYGDGLEITRTEGQGNGALALELTAASASAIATDEHWRKDQITYRRGKGPVNVKVIDPLKVPESEFEIWFKDDTLTPGNLDDAYWYIVKLPGTASGDTVNSERVIDLPYEQVIPKWGISVSISQTKYSGDFTDPIGTGSMTFSDPSKAWFTGVADADGEEVANWIRSGAYVSADAPIYNDRGDVDQLYESILGGTWAPWSLAGHAEFQGGTSSESNADSPHASAGLASIKDLPSVQLVITSDKSKWSRSPVFEMGANTTLNQGGARRMQLRASPSIDKDGRKSGTEGCNEAEAQLTNGTSMGWFPGYAIDLETGERLNIGYGEDSFWAGEIGRDMIWNPNDKLYTTTGAPFFGGGHWIYVFKNDRRTSNVPSGDRVPQYDQGQYIRSTMEGDGTQSRLKVFRGIGWVGSAVVVPGRQLLETDVRVVLNVKKPYRNYVDYPQNPWPIEPVRNEGLPLYTFSTNGLATVNDNMPAAENALDLINVVPNPYYAFSGYETTRLDNRIKFVNLPQTCTISIYTVSGTLVRKYSKDNDLTFLDWDLKNASNIPIAGGVYICHIDVPGVGERVIKWFGALRPIDLQNF
ncbi:MAG: T9SS C-terminal target domain-containing protein [Flavobacteriales bacterium]|nr:T9SS C-terminal target domain-containing protein [Flavobacteriales bacterium]